MSLKKRSKSKHDVMFKGYKRVRNIYNYKFYKWNPTNWKRVRLIYVSRMKGPTFDYNSFFKKRISQYILKKHVLNTYSSSVVNYTNANKTKSLRRHKKNMISTIMEQDRKKKYIKLKKNKYLVASLLYTILTKLPRKRHNDSYINKIGKKKWKYKYTMPFKLSKSRFIANKLLKAYYTGIKTKQFKQISSRKRIHPHFIRGPKTTRRKHNQLLVGDSKTKNFIIALEERLCSAILRLLNFKPLSKIRVRRFIPRKWRTTYMRKRRQRRLPFMQYTRLQVKQLITHGHIYINNKKVTYPNVVTKLGDKIKIKGFIENYRNGQENGSTSSRNNTLILRRFSLTKQNYLHHDFKGSKNKIGTKKRKSEAIVRFIKRLRIKRFIEIFYMTYRNLHYIERLNRSKTEVENHIRPIFDHLGFNQSLFLLWPVAHMLEVSTWGPKLKKHFIGLSRRKPYISGNYPSQRLAKLKKANKKKQHLQHLLKWKKIQNVEQTTNSGSKSPIKKRSSIPDEIIRILHVNPEFIYAQSSRSYASMVYGTNYARWVIVQQCTKKGRYTKIYHSLGFYNVELDFFHLAMRYYI